MKKMVICTILSLISINLSSFGACSIEKLKTQEYCSGAAAPVKIEERDIQNSNINNLKNLYQIPTIAVPNSYHNGFPIINPNEGCPFGTCLQK